MHKVHGTSFAHSSVQFSSVSQSCPTLCDPMNHSTPGLPVHHQLPEFTQTHALCKHGCGETPTPLEGPGHLPMEGLPYNTVGSLMRGVIWGAAGFRGELCGLGHQGQTTFSTGCWSCRQRMGVVLERNQSKGASLLFLDACAHARTGVCVAIFFLARMRIPLWR